ncbi:hypothetical protein DSO57_1000152 [Entomophthora muscae]|uniref:Uncharacterized protein n=1 Tax=Entomophthora muscae TaxID=34485 RepID=A0ACC2TA36_9FUNG|nr:hypothetical protein DSO57_1000152 [Entomophthora muscae]
MDSSKASPNGVPVILGDRAQALAQYPHARKFGGLIYVSGISSRRPDNTHVGVTIKGNGEVILDITEQTRAVINNIRAILESCGSGLKNVIDITVFLVDMKDYKKFNEVYNQYFEAETGPSRTTVAVHQLPHPNLLIEIKAVSADPAFLN